MASRWWWSCVLHGVLTCMASSPPSRPLLHGVPAVGSMAGFPSSAMALECVRKRRRERKKIKSQQQGKREDDKSIHGRVRDSVLHLVPAARSGSSARSGSGAASPLARSKQRRVARPQVYTCLSGGGVAGAGSGPSSACRGSIGRGFGRAAEARARRRAAKARGSGGGSCCCSCSGSCRSRAAARGGSPCRRPHLTWNPRPGTPLSKTAKREEWKRVSIQSHQRGGNPRTAMILRRLSQLMESKALA